MVEEALQGLMKTSENNKTSILDWNEISEALNGLALIFEYQNYSLNFDCRENFLISVSQGQVQNGQLEGFGRVIEVNGTMQ